MTGRDHSACVQALRTAMAAKGWEVHVSGVPPLVPGEFTGEPFTCEHGVELWTEPTGEGVAGKLAAAREAGTA